MKRRIELESVAPAAMRAMLTLEQYVRTSGLESELIELVKLRASYLNGCAYCVDMHSKAPAPAASRSSGCTPSQSGARRRSSRGASARRWPGPRR